MTQIKAPEMNHVDTSQDPDPTANPTVDRAADVIKRSDRYFQLEPRSKWSLESYSSYAKAELGLTGEAIKDSWIKALRRMTDSPNEISTDKAHKLLQSYNRVSTHHQPVPPQCTALLSSICYYPNPDIIHLPLHLHVPCILCRASLEAVLSSSL
jgi:hypothetical protein